MKTTTKHYNNLLNAYRNIDDYLYNDNIFNTFVKSANYILNMKFDKVPTFDNKLKFMLQVKLNLENSMELIKNCM